MDGSERMSDSCGPLQEHSEQYEAVQMEHAQGESLAAASAVKDVEPPEHFVCPISSDLMVDPVMCADGHCYDRACIEAWLADHDTSPLTGAPLEHKTLVAVHVLRKGAAEWARAHGA